MKKMWIVIGLVVLAVVVAGCTQGTLAGEATRTQDAQRCPNGCDIIKKLNSVVVIESPSTPDDYESWRSCNDVCTGVGRMCIDAQFGIPNLVDFTNTTGTRAIFQIVQWDMTRCDDSRSNALQCRCY